MFLNWVLECKWKIRLIKIKQHSQDVTISILNDSYPYLEIVVTYRFLLTTFMNIFTNILGTRHLPN